MQLPCHFYANLPIENIASFNEYSIILTKPIPMGTVLIKSPHISHLKGLIFYWIIKVDL
jgi:hypothetical protein